MVEKTPQSGHDGPYPAPVEVLGFTVRPEWIDYNGHMNVGYYGVAFDQALDVMLEEQLGLGKTYVETAGAGPYILQSHVQFRRELLEGEAFHLRFRLLDHDAKRLIYFGEMYADRDGVLCATQEALIMNVSQETGRGATFPDWARARLARMLADHRALPLHPAVGAALGLRR
ncbi:thioesterase family protein [Ruegeria pomeroyi]|nr:thioesterase family protein [Ruegeria pomeroyi]